MCLRFRRGTTVDRTVVAAVVPCLSETIVTAVPSATKYSGMPLRASPLAFLGRDAGHAAYLKPIRVRIIRDLDDDDFLHSIRWCSLAIVNIETRTELLNLSWAFGDSMRLTVTYWYKVPHLPCLRFEVRNCPF